MTPERWKQIEELLEAAMHRTPAERSAFLRDACASDPALLQHVETLIESYEKAEGFMESPIVEDLFDERWRGDDFNPLIGKRIGSYRVVRELGRGGMGAVYLAVRADDVFQKRVAIKLVKRGMDTDFILRRFRQERQILASLEHPNIARLLDGGTTDDGLPYFVMEYIEGLPVNQYCDAQKLPTTERLRLFLKVCAAVAFAHQNLVLHRDLKPSNVLVLPDGTPKLLDFGIAKLLNPEMGSQTLDPTTMAMRMMTPEYASPEQVRGATVTKSSDVYSMGVLLYELLTGHRPYRLDNRMPEELARVICEEEPERPSVAVNLIEVLPSNGPEPIEITPETVSRVRDGSPEKLRRQLSGSLDNILLKALRKEQAQRYQTVEELAEDIRRFLEGVPVSASAFLPTPQPQGVHESVDPVTLPKAIAVLPFKTLRVEERDDEFLGMGMADAIITKLSNIRRIVVRPTSSVIKYFDGEHDALVAGRELNVNFVLDGRIQRAGERVRVTVQLVRTRDGSPMWAAQFDEKFTDIFTVEDSISGQVAEALMPRLSGEERELLSRRETDDPEAYQAYLKGRYHWSLFTEESFGRALEQFKEAIELDPQFALAHVGVADYYNWAAIYGMGSPRECFPKAKAAALRAIELDDSLAEAHAALGFTTVCYDWDPAAAELRFRRALELNPNSATAHHWYANLLAAQGRFDEAVREIKRAQELNPLSLLEISMTGWLCYQARRYEMAASELRRALELDEGFGNGHMVLGNVYERMGMYDEALASLRKSVELLGGSVVPLWGLGYALAASGRPDEARGVLDELARHSETAYVSPYFFAVVHAGLGDADAAFSWLEKAYEARDEWLTWLGTEPKLDVLRADPRYRDLLRRVGIYGASLSSPAAGHLATRASSQLRDAPSSDPRSSDEEAQKLYEAGHYYATKRTAEGLRQAIERLERSVERDPTFALAYAELAECYALLNWYAEPPPEGAWERAKRAALSAVEADEKLAAGHSALGFVLSHFDRDWPGAEREFRRALELDPDNAVSRRWHALNLSAMGHHEEALAEIRRAQEMRPNSPVMATAVANVLFFARRYDEAIEECRRALDMDPGSLSTHVVLRWSYEKTGAFEEALAVNEQERAFAGDTPTTRAKHAHVLASCGRAAEAREILSDLVARRGERWVTAYEIAVIFALLGERDEAFSWLAVAEREHAVGLTYVRVDPRLDNLRGDQRFKDLLRRVGFMGDEREESEPPAAPKAHVPLVGAAGSHQGVAVGAAGTHAAAREGRGVHASDGSTDGGNGFGRLAPAVPTFLEAPAGKSAPAVGWKLGAAFALLAVGLVWLGMHFFAPWRTPISAAFMNPKIVRLTTTGNASNAAVAPDGKYLVYVVSEGGRQSIWGRQIAVDNSKRLVAPAEVNFRGLTFSPDGVYVYYVAEEKGGRSSLFQFPAFGGSVTKVKEGVDGPARCSPDGRQFAFVRNDPERGEDVLVIADATGDGERWVAARKYPEHFSTSSAPAWSPDGQKLAVVVESSDANGFHVKPMEVGVGGGWERQLSSKRWIEVGQMRWLADGQGLVATAQDENSSTHQLWHFAYPGGTARRLTNDLNDYRGLSLSSDSSLLVTTQRQTLTTVSVVSKNDFSRPAQITSGAGRYVDLSWTPQGTILYASDASGNADIWEMNADGTEQRQLTAGVGRNYAPVATPDGRHVLFHSNRSGSWQVWRMERDGGDPVQLTRGAENSNWPAVTPDGRFVIYEHVGAGTLTTLWKIPMEGGQPQRLTSTLSLRPSISPDGKLIVYWHKDDRPNAPWQIAVVPVEGGEPLRVFDVPQNDADGNSSIRWTPDGSGLVYVDFHDNVTDLRVQPVTGGPSTRMTNFTREQFYSIDLSRDNRFLLANGLTTSDVVMIRDSK